MDTNTILCTNKYSGLPLEIIRDCTPTGFQLLFPEDTSREALEYAIANADYLLAGGRTRIDSALLDKGRRLRMIQRSGVGLDTLDLDAIQSRGIPLYVNRGVNAQSVAEHTLLLILACLRRLTVLDINARRGIWEKQRQGVQTRELCGRTVGLIGLGSIGKRVMQLLKAFGAVVLYYDLHRLAEEEEQSLGIRFAEPEALFRQAEIISLHCALTAETKNLLCGETFAQMRKGVIIVNTARGGLIDEDALLAAIRDGTVAFAGLDVHAVEPFSTDDPLLQSERVIATPHVAGVTYDSFRRMMQEAMENIALFDRGETERIKEKRYI